MRSGSIRSVRDQLVRRFRSQVRLRAKTAGLPPCDFEDWVRELVGEGIALALNQIDKWDPERGDFLYWAYLKTKCLIRNDLIRLKARKRFCSEALEPEMRDHRQKHDPQKRGMIQQQLHEIFQGLTEDQGKALVLRHLLDLSVKEIEALTGRPSSTIYTLLSRAGKKARDKAG
jgi:RNA polymerase sigma factor (sigma-70 family)